VKLPTLYKKTSTGAIQEWSISATFWPGYEKWGVVRTQHGQVGGKMQVSEDIIKVGKNIGKSNETNPDQQAALEATAKWEKQLKKGYVKSIAEAEAGKVDRVIEGGVAPMLAHRFDEHGDKIKFPAYVQPKFDGHRCIAVIENGKATLWTRTRKPITGLPHIIRDLEVLGRETPNFILDGELYVHQLKERGAEVPLTKGQVALVSLDDLEEINQHKWSFLDGGYAVRNQREDGKSKMIYMHRQLLDAPDDWDVDHKNGDKLDNRRSNLRLCSPSQNAGNQKKRASNTSGFKGVYYFKRDGTWQAQITVGGEKIHIGYFSTPEEAAAAYDAEAVKRFGEFAFTNAAADLNFENLSSLIRTPEPQPGHEVVQYHVYDLVNDHDQVTRLADLRAVVGRSHSSLVLVETIEVADEDEMMLAFEGFLAQGYEGLIVRNADGLYVNKRSRDLQKVKEFMDSEYPIVGVEAGRGKMADKAIFICKTAEGTEFWVKMKGSLDALKKYIDNPKLAIGRMLTVQYQGITGAAAVPRFPVGLRLREDV
jgi:hypothetical protein